MKSRRSHDKNKAREQNAHLHLHKPTHKLAQPTESAAAAARARPPQLVRGLAAAASCRPRHHSSNPVPSTWLPCLVNLLHAAALAGAGILLQGWEVVITPKATLLAKVLIN